MSGVTVRENPPLRGWCSASGTPAYASELLLASDNVEGFCETLHDLESELAGSLFLLVKVSQPLVVCVPALVAAYRQRGLKAKLCIALNRAAMKVLRPMEISDESVGLLLDEVDAESPLADLLANRLEAVRFRARFVAAAAAELRLGFTLEAMLGLAKDLGLRTFGECDGTSSTLQFDFGPSRAGFQQKLPDRSQVNAMLPARRSIHMQRLRS